MAGYANRIQEVSKKLSNVLVPVGMMASVGVPIYNAVQELMSIVAEMDSQSKDDELKAEQEGNAE